MAINYHVTDLNFEPDDLDASLDPQAGGSAYGKTIWTPDEMAAYLNRSGTKWGTTGKTSDGDASVINYAFFNTQDEVAANGYTYTLNGTNYFGLSEYFHFGVHDAQRAATREAMRIGTTCIAVSFVETTPTKATSTSATSPTRPARRPMPAFRRRRSDAATPRSMRRSYEHRRRRLGLGEPGRATSSSTKASTA